VTRLPRITGRDVVAALRKGGFEIARIKGSHATEGYLASTNELMSLHVSLATRRGGPMAPGLMTRLARIQAAHDARPRPPQAGRRIGLTTGSTTG